MPKQDYFIYKRVDHFREWLYLNFHIDHEVMSNMLVLFGKISKVHQQIFPKESFLSYMFVFEKMCNLLNYNDPSIEHLQSVINRISKEKRHALHQKWEVILYHL